MSLREKTMSHISIVLSDIIRTTTLIRFSKNNIERRSSQIDYEAEMHWA